MRAKPRSRASRTAYFHGTFIVIVYIVHLATFEKPTAHEYMFVYTA